MTLAKINYMCSQDHSSPSIVSASANHSARWLRVYFCFHKFAFLRNIQYSFSGGLLHGKSALRNPKSHFFLLLITLCNQRLERDRYKTDLPEIGFIVDKRVNPKWHSCWVAWLGFSSSQAQADLWSAHTHMNEKNLCYTSPLGWSSVYVLW